MRLEDEMRTITERSYVLPTNSGSAALIVALKAGQVPNGADVILPAICCPAVLFAIQLAGYSPVLADISLDDLCMNVEQIKKAVTDNTKAIIAVHAYGHYCQIDEIERFAIENKLYLIEDACLTIGGSFGKKLLGSFGQVSIFSFGYDKIINCGCGGALVTDNDAVFNKAQQIVNNNSLFAWDMMKEKQRDLYYKLSIRSDLIATRQTYSKMYDELLDADKVKKFQPRSDVVYWRYPVLFKGERDKFIEDARKEDIIFTKHYLALNNLMTGVSLANADYVSDHIINLFVRPETSKEQLDRSIAFINDYQL